MDKFNLVEIKNKEHVEKVFDTLLSVSFFIIVILCFNHYTSHFFSNSAFVCLFSFIFVVFLVASSSPSDWTRLFCPPTPRESPSQISLILIRSSSVAVLLNVF